MKRAMVFLAVVGLLPLLGSSGAWAGGGANSPPFGSCPPGADGINGCRTIVGPAVSGTFSLDPHNEGVTTTAGQIFSLKLTLKSGSTASVKAKGMALPDTGYALGCFAPLTFIRFEYHPENPHLDKQTTLYDFIFPSSVVQDLFTALGVTTDPGVIDPVITLIPSGACTVDPHNRTVNDPNNPNDLPGILQFNAVIQFRVPCTFGVDNNCSLNPLVLDRESP